MRAESINEQDRSVECVMSTEEPVLAWDMNRWEPVLEVLLMSGATFHQQVPLLDTHDRSTVRNQIGSTRNIRIEGAQMIGRNVYSETDLGNHAWELARGGHLTDNSIGYSVTAYQTIEPGETAIVNGRSFTAPANRALRIGTEWDLKENSNCPIGADTAAKMRASLTDVSINSQPKTHGANTMIITAAMRAYMQMHVSLSATASDDEARAAFESLSDDQKAACRAAVVTEPKTAAAPVVGNDIVAQARSAAQAEYRSAFEAERQRASGIRSAAEGLDIPTATVERCISEGMTVEASQAEFLKAVRTSRPAGFNVLVQNDVSISGRHLEAAIMLRSGQVSQDEAVKEIGGQDAAQVVDFAGRKMRGTSLMDIIRMAIQLDGRQAPMDRDEMIRVGFSTGTLPVILGNTANKMVMKGFNDAAETWRKWCSVHPVSDFKANPILRLNGLGDLEVVGNGGNVKYLNRSEESAELQADTYGGNFGLTRKDAVNDDLGVLTRVPMMLGRKSAQRVSKLVYTVLLANKMSNGSTDIFSATAHYTAQAATDYIVNLLTSSALSYTTLGTALSAFRKFRDQAGEPIDVEPALLMVPPELERTARELTESDLMIVTALGSTSAAAKEGNKNGTYRGLETVVESRLSNANYTGYSATSWYLMPRPVDSDNLGVCFLNGQQGPTIEQFNAGPDRDGIVWRVLTDVGCAAVDFYMLKANA